MPAIRIWKIGKSKAQSRDFDSESFDLKARKDVLKISVSLLGRQVGQLSSDALHSLDQKRGATAKWLYNSPAFFSKPFEILQRKIVHQIASNASRGCVDAERSTGFLGHQGLGPDDRQDIDRQVSE